MNPAGAGAIRFKIRGLAGDGRLAEVSDSNPTVFCWQPDSSVSSSLQALSCCSLLSLTAEESRDASSWRRDHNTVTAQILFQIRLRGVGRPRREIVAHADSRAGVPPQNRIIIPCRTDRLGPLVAFHRVPQPFIGVVARSGPPLLQPGLGLPFADDPFVIGPLVLILDAGQDLLRLAGADGV